jgi:putative endonuclease
MITPRRKFGDIGEQIAEDFLVSKGYAVLHRNYKKRYGEIDLVAKDGKDLVFVEVKTRSNRNIQNFLPEQSVNRLKMRKLQKICEVYLAEKRYSPHQRWQIDIIAISLDTETKKANIRHIKNAVWEQRY